MSERITADNVIGQCRLAQSRISGAPLQAKAPLPEPIKKIALTHMAINLTAVVLNVNIWLCAKAPPV
jgi:hypothetical protein